MPWCAHSVRRHGPTVPRLRRPSGDVGPTTSSIPTCPYGSPPAAVSDAVALLPSAGVPAAEVVLPPAVLGDEQLIHRDFFELLQHPVAGWQPYAGLPFRVPPAGGWCKSPPPTLGQHNDEVLGSELGLGREELDELRALQVIGERPSGL